MKKVFLALIVLLCLSGCTNISDEDVITQTDKVFKEIDEIGTYRFNNTMPYYSYYLPSDMSEEPLDSDSIVIKYNDSKVIMNLNINGIINKRYYNSHYLEDEGLFDSNNLIYENKGSLKGSDNYKKQFILRLYKFDNIYILDLTSSDMDYCGTASKADIRNLVKHLLTIIKNTSVSYEDVLLNFSNKDVIDYQKKQVDLFDSMLPVNGELSSMLTDEAVIGDGQIIVPEPTEPSKEELPEETIEDNENTDENSVTGE